MKIFSTKKFNKELELGLPVLGYMKIPDKETIYKTEISFSSGVVKPLMREMANIFPCLDFCLAQIEINIDNYEKLLS